MLCSILMGALALTISACTTYQIEGPESPLKYCAQSSESALIAASNNKAVDFEPIPVRNWTEVYALKETDGQRVVLFPNRLSLGEARINHFYNTFLWFRSLAGSKVVVTFSVGERSEEVVQAEQEILLRFPDSEFVRPWMVEVRLVPVSPWFIRREVVLPCQGFPLKDVPMEFLLNRQETQKLNSLPDDGFVLAGTLSYADLLSGQFYQQSFSLRKSQLQSR